MKILLFAAVFIVQCRLFAQSDSIQKVIDYYSGTRNFSGAVLIAKNGNQQFLKGIGLADRRFGTMVDAKNKFRIASITKTFTAILVMQLVDEGKLDLKATIGKYFPEYNGEAKDKTTIYQLLTYSSGIPNCEHVFGDTVYKIPISVDNFIARYCSDNLEAKPGTKFNYDNGDFIILGRIMEKVTGSTFKDLLTRRILTPLKMNNTGLLTSQDIISGMAETYTYDDSSKRFLNDPPYYIENYFSSAAMYSTAEDMLRFDQAIFNGKLLSKNGLKTLLTSDPDLGNVALGFWEAKKYGPIDTRFYYRPGGIYGATANWIHVVDPSLTIIVLSNNSAANLFEFSQQLYLAATGKPIKLTHP